MEHEQIEALRTRLVAEKETLERQLKDYGAAAEDDSVQVDVNEGFADSAQATSERSEALSMVEQIRHHHEEVVASLARLEEGTYGVCERCGSEIPFERLEIVPSARLCVQCKQEVGG